MHGCKNIVKMKEEKDLENIKEEEVKAEKVETEAKEDSEKTAKKKAPKKSKKTKSKSKEDKLKDEIEILNQNNGELKDKYLRLVAEYDNFRKRTAKEKIDLREQSKADLLIDFLNVVDDIDRAMQHVNDAKDVEALKEGMNLINHKFYEFLKANNVQEIEAKEKEFDTDLHEAITKFPVQEEEQKGKVIDVVQKGFKINEKVIRFAKVVVGE